MEPLLRLHDAQGHWNIAGIEFAIQERIGDPQDFIGRVEELEYLYTWAGSVRRGISRSVAFLGRRKIGKSLILERLYNILYSEHKGLIPFYYEFQEGRRSGREFCHDFVTRFYLQVVGYLTRDLTLIREAVNKEKTVMGIEELQRHVASLTLPYKDQILRRLENNAALVSRDYPPYEYVLSAVAAPDAFATMIGVNERIVQMLDEFQYLNMYVDAGVEAKPCKAYMSPAESRLAPLLITGSLMGVVSEELMRWLPQRFTNVRVPQMKLAETIAMTLQYGRLYDHALTPEIATYIAYVTNNVPGRIVQLLATGIGKPHIATFEDVDRALELEAGADGNIKNDWDEYLLLAMDAVNDVNLRRITYFLCQHEGEWFAPSEIKAALSLTLDEARLRQELELLYKYDIVEMGLQGRYGGVFDRTLKKVLMTNYADVLNLPVESFDSYFKADNMLDYLQERVEQLELSLEQAEKVRHALAVLRGEHNDLKGAYYEREVLLDLLNRVMRGDGGLVAGMTIADCTFALNYHLETGEEIDLVLEDAQTVVMVECKNYAPHNLHALTPQIVDDFVNKARRLHGRFPGKALRLAFASKHGLLPALAEYLAAREITAI